MVKLTRRAALAGTGAFIFANPLAHAKGRTLHLFAGTSAKGLGIFPLDLDTGTGDMTVGNPHTSIKAPGYGATAHGLHYLVNQAANRLMVFGADWSLKADIAAPDRNPCHIALDATRSWLSVPHYSGNTFALWRLDAKGMPQNPPTLVHDEGSGPNLERQKSPHPHWTGFSPDNKLFYTVDLGNDTVMVAPFDPAGGIGPRIVAYKGEPGEGPRQLGFQPRLPLVYQLAEMGSAVTSLRRAADGTLTRLQRLSTLPDGYSGINNAAHIAVNRAGTRVYASNRGHNSIAVFEAGPNGKLNRLQLISSGGNWPRFFLLLEEYGLMLVANQYSGEIALFRIGRNGLLTPAGKQAIVVEATYIGLA